MAWRHVLCVLCRHLQHHTDAGAASCRLHWHCKPVCKRAWAHTRAMAGRARQGCGTKPTHRVWVNLDPCGLACAATTWGIVLYANFAVTVSRDGRGTVAPSPASPKANFR